MQIATQYLLLCALAELVASQYPGTTATYCWTQWLDRDDPSGSGDWETLSDFPKNQVCLKPVGIVCETTAHTSFQNSGMQSTPAIDTNCVDTIHDCMVCTIEFHAACASTHYAYHCCTFKCRTVNYCRV